MQIPQVMTQDRAVMGGIETLKPWTNSGLTAAMPSFMAVKPPTRNRNSPAMIHTPTMMTSAQTVSVQATAFIPPIQVKTIKTSSRITQQVMVLQSTKDWSRMTAPVT